MKALYTSFIVVAVLAVSACEKPHTSVVQTDNPSFKVEKLFTVNGCTIYRFSDSQRAHFADCSGSVSAQARYICGHTGKNGDQPVYCYRENLVETSK